MDQIGIAITTYNRPNYLNTLLSSIPEDVKKHTFVLNDGEPIKQQYNNITYIDNKVNLGSGKNKSKGLNTLLDKRYKYLFTIEDDMIIKDSSIFEKYIKAYEKSGIQHFNYGPGSPFNRVQKIKDYDLHNRHLLDQKSKPNPKLIIDYGDDIKIALYEHTVAMFSFFTREVIEKVGVFDPDYRSAFDHVDHTYRIIKAGYHPPFWWFADIADSHEYITEQPDAIQNSSIAKDEQKWMKEVIEAREIYKNKHGHYPNILPYNYTEKEVLDILRTINNTK